MFISDPDVQVKNAIVLEHSDKCSSAAEVRALPQCHAKEDSMTDKPNDEDLEKSNHENDILDDEASYDDNDPIIAEMKAAEKEIEELESKKTDLESEQKTPEFSEEKKVSDKQVKDESVKTEKSEAPMVPKARLDEVLSERELLRSQIAYMQGLEDARVKSTDGQKQDTVKQDDAGSKVDEIDAAITNAEQKKLELAEKYDEGELSTRDWKEAELKIDRELRGLSDKREVERLNELQESSRSETQAALEAERVEDFIRSQAIEIQKNHPNVAVIEAVPEHIKASIWKDIEAEALQNLSNQGINVRDSSPNVRLAVIKEKARLTERYTPDKLQVFLPEGFTASQNQQGKSQTGQGKPSVSVEERSQKIDMANSQPPTISDMKAGAGDAELTESDLEGMSNDQIADLIEKAPHRIQRALGLTSI